MGRLSLRTLEDEQVVLELGAAGVAAAPASEPKDVPAPPEARREPVRRGR
jgi:hypothetical protein